MTDVSGSAAIYIDLAGAAIAFTLYRISLQPLSPEGSVNGFKQKQMAN